jgi:DNA modification methylase
MEDINYALVEETRPEIYAAMKYWGKKPHNIWREYIRNYTPEAGLFLDPFSGSAVSAFEAVKAGRKAIAFDLNPMTAFIIDVFTSKYNPYNFRIACSEIISAVTSDLIYKQNFYVKCDKCEKLAKVVAYKWDCGKVYELAIQCDHEKIRYTKKPTASDNIEFNSMQDIAITNWIPDDEFRNTSSFDANFIKNIGGKKFVNLWTNRNLYILSLIFDMIQNNTDVDVKKQLMFSFVQTLHLTTKMCVPRNPDANRDFSTSWGRSAYLAPVRQMEMNPLHVFSGSCFGKQSTDSCLKNLHTYLGKDEIKTLYVSKANKSNNSKNYDIKYGIIDIATITDYLDEGSIDFIITDPPYGGLVQYLDLSTIWLNWLKKYDNKYTPNYEPEITVNNKNSIQLYEQKFTKALKNLNCVLKDDGKIVFTFHNNKIAIWNSFLNSIMMAGFKIEKVIHQQNKRTGESNVANPYGTSGTDFYIRCIKTKVLKLNDEKSEFENFIVQTTIRIIAQRNEPTPYQILFNNLLAELSSAGFRIHDFDENMVSFLKKHLADVFTITNNTATTAGDFWWFTEPAKHIAHPDKPLTERVEESLISLLRRKVAISYDEALAEIFVQYPNGLTPSIASIVSILKKYAIKSNEKWIYNGGDLEREFTKHTEVIRWVIDLGKKMGYKTFVGKREQGEAYGKNLLKDFADFTDLKFLSGQFDSTTLSRLEMIDALWIKDENIVSAIEVENSTNFTSGIQRASNLDKSITKLMIIPDYREQEIRSILDPLFVYAFADNNWKFINYTDIEKNTHLRSISLSDLLKFCKVLR